MIEITDEQLTAWWLDADLRWPDDAAREIVRTVVSEIRRLKGELAAERQSPSRARERRLRGALRALVTAVKMTAVNVGRLGQMAVAEAMAVAEDALEETEELHEGTWAEAVAAWQAVATPVAKGIIDGTRMMAQATTLPATRADLGAAVAVLTHARHVASYVRQGVSDTLPEVVHQVRAMSAARFEAWTRYFMFNEVPFDEGDIKVIGQFSMGAIIEILRWVRATLLVEDEAGQKMMQELARGPGHGWRRTP